MRTYIKTSLMILFYLIVAIFVILVAGKAYIGYYAYADSSVEIKIDKFLDRLLLNSKLIKEFPQTLCPGLRRYYLNPTGPNGSPANTLVIDASRINEDSVSQCRIWLEARGYKKTSAGRRSFVEMKNDQSKRVSVELADNELTIWAEY